MVEPASEVPAMKQAEGRVEWLRGPESNRSLKVMSLTRYHFSTPRVTEIEIHLYLFETGGS